MRKLFSLVVVLAFVLAACGGEAPATAPAATQAPTEAMTTEAPPSPVPSQTTAATATVAETAAVEVAVTVAVPAVTAAAAVEAAAAFKTYKLVPGESTVEYQVGETFISQNNRFATAIGVTTQVSGEIMLDPANPQATQIGEIQVDVSQFQSDSGRRDGYIRNNGLESATYPIATFKVTSIDGLPDSYSEGQELSFTITGELTVREVTRPVTFDVTARLVGEELSGVAQTTLLMSDFGVGPISIAGMLNTEDEVKLSMNFIARP